MTPDALAAAVDQAIAAGREEALLPALEQAVARTPGEAGPWWLLAQARHAAQQHGAALAAVERALALADAPGLRVARAQWRYEAGLPAAEQFAALVRAMPGEKGLLAGWAGALAAEGQVDRAEVVLAEALAQEPDWIEGQARLAALRRTAGQPDPERGYADAIRRLPRHPGLRLAHVHLLAKARRWDDALAALEATAAAISDEPAVRSARVYLLSESGIGADDPDLFAAYRETRDPGLAIAQMRHALRRGAPEEAARLGERFIGTPAAAPLWPYLSLAWRLTGDAQAEWLDRPDALIRGHDLGLSAAELGALAALLRSLHTMQAPYLDQSVRGGTQTDRPLLFRHEPIVARVRAAILAAVRAHVDALPPPEPGHPLLGTPRTALRFAGSWSVRLGSQGYHASHTHPAGWLSSALYVSLPEPMGPPPAGQLLFGQPPPELGLDLAPYRTEAPAVGRLVLFPATTWHGTAPFADGERLTIAFDIAPPRW